MAYIPERRIQREAQRLVEECRKRVPGFEIPYDLRALIWDHLNEVDGLSLDEETPLGLEESSGEKILGKAIAEKRLIMLDPETVGQPFENFTLAHEVGHWVLHCRPHLDGPGQLSLIEEPLPTEFVTLKRQLTPTCKDPLEIQANLFAVHLLMPEELVVRLFMERFGELPLVPPLSAGAGRTASRSELHEFARSTANRSTGSLEPLWKMFGVSTDAMAYRLESLNLVIAEEGLLRC